MQTRSAPLPGGIKELLPLALPIFLAQAMDVTMIFCDRLFLSWLGKEAMAATLTGGVLTYLITTLMIGTLGQIAPLVAQYRGAGQKGQCARVVFQGLLLCAVAAPAILICAQAAGPSMFSFFGHEAILARYESDYFRILSLTVISTSFRTVLCNFFVGIGRSAVVTFATLCGVVVNIPLAYGLIFGAWGLPQWGIRGAAAGTVLAGLLPVAILAASFLSSAVRSEYLVPGWRRFDSDALQRILRYGLPAGTEMLVNVSAFLFFTMSMFSFSPAVAAATTIVLNWDMVCFVPLLGLNQAVASLVGKYLGAGDRESALRAAWNSLKSAWVYAGLITIVYFSFARQLVLPFAEAEGSEEIVSFATFMLRISCLYFLFDGTYNILGGILKGSGDTVWTMLVSNALIWTMASSVFYAKNHLGLTPIGAWLMLTALVLSLCLLYSIRFLQKRWLSRSMIQPHPER